jgi:hypothetical protein
VTGILIAALALGAYLIWGSGNSSPAAAAPSCAYSAGLHEFASAGQRPVNLKRAAASPWKIQLEGTNRPRTTDPIYHRWLSLYCNASDWGPATAPIRRTGHLWIQDFGHTAHRLFWNARTHRVRVTVVPALATKAFAARGIHPQWNQPVPASWLNAYENGTNYGAALDPVKAGSTSSDWQRQVFVDAAGTFSSDRVTWAKASPPNTGLYQAHLWGPISKLVQSFGTDVKTQNTPGAAQYLAPNLATQILSTCPQKLLGFDDWPTKVRYAIQDWNRSLATVKSKFVNTAKPAVDQLTLSGGPTWTISAVQHLHGGATNPTCPPWSPPPNAFPGTYAVGDSVTIDAQDNLQTMGITVNAAVSEQFETGIAVLQQLKDAGTLPPRVVIALGTNGPPTTADYVSALNMLKGETRVILLTVHEPRWWEHQVNATVHAMAKRFSNVRVADFYAASKNHPEWFAYDGIHLQPSGALGFAHVIANALAEP